MKGVHKHDCFLKYYVFSFGYLKAEEFINKELLKDV